jgi:WS/DGAT/MGAT family acyltransferase
MAAVSQKLDDEDAARLGMETQENPMVITALVRLDGTLALDELVRLVDERILVRERMRATIVRPGLFQGAPRWQEVPTTARAQVTRVVIPDDGGEAALADLLGDLGRWRIDQGGPPWRMWLVDGAGGGSAIVLRIHHAIADGLSLLALLFGFCDEGAGGAPEELSLGSASPKTRGRLHEGTSIARRALGVARLVFRHADAPPQLAGRLSGKKRLAWTAPLDLGRIRAAAHAADAHVNDFLCAVVAGALRDFERFGGTDPAEPVHALVPVALPHEAGQLGNRFASVYVELPVHIAHPIARLHAARDAMRAARARGGLGLGRSFVAAAAFAGTHAERAAVRLLSKRATLVLTDLAGPPLPLHVGGHAIRDVLFAAPSPGSVALSVSAFGYAGSLRVTIATDEAVCPEPARIAKLVEIHACATMSALAP